MAKSKKKALKQDKISEEPEKSKKQPPHSEEEDFDFGGFPKDVSLKRNMGCGG
ncbi:MAG: hypothetical protein HWE21_01710 [Cytophagia bacterium]|nr:hypothetical protein [Cytophagia bacterium]